ncbi:MAG: hypothetical protein AAFV45_07710 [Pseudomonadota bacterium]
MFVDLLENIDADAQKIVLIIVLSTACGSLLTFIFQSLQWKRQKKHELLQHQLREGKELADEATRLINRRFFALQRLFWAIQGQSPDIELMWKNYYADVIEWNQKLTSLRIRTRLFTSKEVENLLVDDQDLDRTGHPTSLHYSMRDLHKKILQAKEAGPLNEAIAEDVERQLAHTAEVIQRFENQLLVRLLSHKSRSS